MSLKTYRDLNAWKLSMDLAVEIYSLSRGLPADERFGLTAQIRRAAGSTPANIAEGYGRTNRGEYLYHLSVARGSLMEVETHLTLAVRLKFVSRQQAMRSWDLTQQVGKLLASLIGSLQTRPKTLNPKP
jgi:four helix bundle protein